MRVVFGAAAFALILPLASCQLPRPQFAPDQSASCVASHDPPSPHAQLFITLRRPDCSGPVFLTNFRSETPRYASQLGGAIMFHDPEVWAVELDRRVAANPRIRPLLYIHGYNTTNAEAVERSAIIAASVGGAGSPVVALTWPSYGSKPFYYWDEANAEWAGDGAAQVVAGLAKRLPKFILVAHSMGNRPALEAIAALSPESRAGEIDRLVMASPDVDRDTAARRLGSPEHSIPTTIYVSLKDQALSASWRGHGYARAGDFSWWVTGRDPHYPFAWLANVEIVDTTAVDDLSLVKMKIGHTAFVSTRAGRADLCRLARGGGKGRRGLRPIAALHELDPARNNYFELFDVKAGDGCDLE